jgi:hypothetical protein
MFLAAIDTRSDVLNVKHSLFCFFQALLWLFFILASCFGFAFFTVPLYIESSWGLILDAVFNLTFPLMWCHENSCFSQLHLYKLFSSLLYLYNQIAYLVSSLR